MFNIAIISVLKEVRRCHTAQMLSPRQQQPPHR